MSFLLADCKKLDFGGLLAVNGGAGCSGGTSISEGTTISIENTGYNPGNIEGISLPPSGTSGPKSWNSACDGGIFPPPPPPPRPPVTVGFSSSGCNGSIVIQYPFVYTVNEGNSGNGKTNVSVRDYYDMNNSNGNSQIFVSEKRYY